MRAELRPSSLGEILDRTAQMYRSHFLLYFGIAAVMYSGVLVITLLSNVLLLSHTGSNAQAFAGYSLLVSLSIGFISIVPIAVAMAAIMQAVAKNYLGETTTIRQAYSSIGRLWYRYILILVAMYVYSLIPAALLSGATAGLLVLTPQGFARNMVIGLMGVLVAVAFLAAFWWLLRWLLAVPASLMENLKVHRSLKRSAVLTKGARGRIFVMLLLVGAVMMIIQYAIQIPMFIFLIKSKGVPTLTTQILGSFGIFLSGSFVVPIYSIALTLFYYDQRIRKEGYDVEWLMEQAAMTPASSGTEAPGALPQNTFTQQTGPSGPAI